MNDLVGVALFAITTIGSLLQKKEVPIQSDDDVRKGRSQNPTNIVRVQSEFSIGLSRVNSISLLNELGQLCQPGLIAVYVLKVAGRLSIAMGVGYLALKAAGINLNKSSKS